MSTTLSRSQTLAFGPKCCLKMPMVPGPQTSCVMSTSTFTQMLSPGAVAFRPAARARIFSVIVCDGIGELLRLGGTPQLYQVKAVALRGQTAPPPPTDTRGRSKRGGHASLHHRRDGFGRDAA